MGTMPGTPEAPIPSPADVAQANAPARQPGFLKRAFQRAAKPIGGVVAGLDLLAATAGHAGAASNEPVSPVPPTLPGIEAAQGNPNRTFAARTFEANLALLGPSATSIEKDLAKVNYMTQFLKAEATKMSGGDENKRVEAFGYRISNAWKGADGFWYMAYQGGILQQGPDGQTNRWNTLDMMHQYGLDAALDNGSLSVTVPPHEDFSDNSGGDINKAFTNRVAMLSIPDNVVKFVNGTLGGVQKVGVFTSHGKDYGPYVVYRTQRVAVQAWKSGLVQRILVGDAAKNAGLVPPDAVIPPQIVEGAPLGVGGGGPETSGLPFPKDIGTIAADGIVLHNLGNKVGINVVDMGLYDRTIGALAKSYKPGGVEFYIYNDRADGGISPLSMADFQRLSGKLQNFNGDQVLGLARYPDSFLDNTRVYKGTRADGVTEIHMGLFLTNPNPTPDQISSMDFNAAVEGIIRITVGDQNRGNPDVNAANQTIFNMRKQGDDAIKITLA